MFIRAFVFVFVFVKQPPSPSTPQLIDQQEPEECGKEFDTMKLGNCIYLDSNEIDIDLVKRLLHMSLGWINYIGQS